MWFIIETPVILAKANYVMYGLNWKSNNTILCLLLWDWIYWSRTTRRAVQILCQVHDNSTPFLWEYIERNNVSVRALYITHCISKRSLELFKFFKWVKSLQLSSKNNDSLLASYDYVRLNSIATLKITTESCLLRGHEIAFQKGQCLSEMSLPNSDLERTVRIVKIIYEYYYII